MIISNKAPIARRSADRLYRLTEPGVCLEEDPLVTALRRKARDLALRGKYKKAAARYEQLLERTSGDAQSVLQLAELRRRVGDIAGARVAYRLAVSLFFHSGWSAKAVAIEHALERLKSTAKRRGWAANLLHRFVEFAGAQWRRVLELSARVIPRHANHGEES